MLLFVDESGMDHRESPYEVLAGVAIHERDLWNVIREIQTEMERQFGGQLSEFGVEMKAKRQLKPKSYRLANQLPPIPLPERAELAKSCLEKGVKQKRGEAAMSHTQRELTAYRQSAIEFAERLWEIIGRYRARTFASIVLPESRQPASADFLRKDYSYLFERYFEYLESQGGDTTGLLVFDEKEKAESRILLDQMQRYFVRTAKGKVRAARIVPEPFFVHSDLTTAIQVADYLAYIVSWSVRLPGMDKPVRPELLPLADAVMRLRFQTNRMDDAGTAWPLWSFTYIEDLRPRAEREND